MRGLICQSCGSEKQIPQYELDKFYVCANCGHVIGYECHSRFFEYNHLAPYNNVYICKDCGKTQYGYTEWKNKKGES